MRLTDRYTFTTTLAERGPVKTRLATDRQSGETVVIKTLSVRRAGSAREIDLFRRECAVLEHLSHGQIPRFITHVVEEEAADGSEAGDVELHLVMERVPGRSLRELVQGGRSFSEREVKDIAIKVATVLAHLHEKSPPVVHRDLKPSNILLRDDGTIVLIDFGAVKRAAAGDTTIVGTFGYMPPEQYEGRARPSADVFALGMTLIALLTHKEPSDFGDEGARGEFRKFANASDRLCALLDDMIAIDPSKRPRDGAELLERLRALDRPAPARAAPAPAPARSAAPAIAAAVAVLVLFGAGVAAFLSFSVTPTTTVVVPEIPTIPSIPSIPQIPQIPQIPIPHVDDDDVLGLALTKFVHRCRDRAVPRVLQSEGRYRSWLKDGEREPTCTERYISYGLYTAYEDAIAECAKIAAALPNMKGGADLAAPFAELARVAAHVIPLLEEAERYYDREIYQEDGCKGAKALHARLMPAFAEMRAAAVSVDDALLRTMERELKEAAAPRDAALAPLVLGTRTVIERALALAALGPHFDDGKPIDLEKLQTSYRALVEAADALEALALKLPPERSSLKSQIVSLTDDVHGFRSTVHQLTEAKGRGRDVRRVFQLTSHDPWRVRGLADLVVRRAIGAWD